MISRPLRHFALAGCLVFLTGICWAVLFVGVPYQDPSPAQLTTEALHSTLSGWMMFTGLASIVVCLAIGIARRVAAHRQASRST